MIGTYCLNIIPTDRSTYFFSLFQRSKNENNYYSQRYAMDHMMQDHLIVGFASEKANPFREKTWSCDLLQKIFQEFFKKFTSCCLISPVLNQLSLLYTSQCTSYRLFAYYGDFNLNLAFFFFNFCVIFFRMIPYTRMCPTIHFFLVLFIIHIVFYWYLLIQLTISYFENLAII